MLAFPVGEDAGKSNGSSKGTALIMMTGESRAGDGTEWRTAMREQRITSSWWHAYDVTIRSEYSTKEWGARNVTWVVITLDISLKLDKGNVYAED